MDADTMSNLDHIAAWAAALERLSGLRDHRFTADGRSCGALGDTHSGHDCVDRGETSIEQNVAAIHVGMCSV